ncbi:TPA: hypothetical protein PCO62_004443 [Klebsiella pneumoniae]|nr:hypothetical protein [Klebsiella pneumoniae]
MTNNQLTDAQISNATLIRLIRWADEHKSHYVAAALRELQERRKADREPVALQPELAKVIYHFRDWNEGFPVERFKADYVISWMLENYPPAQPAPVVPDGYVMVPVKPTREILDEFDSIIDYGAEDSVDAWRRLLAAATKEVKGE